MNARRQELINEKASLANGTHAGAADKFQAAVDKILTRYADSYDTGFSIEVGGGQVAGTPAQITALMLLEQLGGEQVQ